MPTTKPKAQTPSIGHLSKTTRPAKMPTMPDANSQRPCFCQYSRAKQARTTPEAIKAAAKAMLRIDEDANG